MTEKNGGKDLVTRETIRTWKSSELQAEEFLRIKSNSSPVFQIQLQGLVERERVEDDGSVLFCAKPRIRVFARGGLYGEQAGRSVTVNQIEDLRFRRSVFAWTSRSKAVVKTGLSVSDLRAARRVSVLQRLETDDEQIVKVRPLLGETELTLYQIAEHTGFTHVEYLSVMFKRETGMTLGNCKIVGFERFPFLLAVDPRQPVVTTVLGMTEQSINPCSFPRVTFLRFAHIHHVSVEFE